MNIIFKVLSKIKRNRIRNIDYDSIVPCFSSSVTIPKHIFQTSQTKEIPQILKDNINFLKEVNKDWEYRHFDNNERINYIKENYGDVILCYYNRISPKYGAAQADFFRYLLIYKEGGVYLDMKCSILLPLDNLLRQDDHYIISHWDNGKGEPHEGFGLNYKELEFINGGEYINGFIIASSGHKILREVIIQVLKNIDNYNPYIVGVGQDGVFRVTGPNTYTLSVQKCIDAGILDYRIVNIFTEFKFKASVYENDDCTIIRHGNVDKTNYRKESMPIVSSNRIIANILESIFFYLYKIGIKMKII